MRKVSSFLLGTLFGLGLIISGMTNPEKVLGFLDIAGQWDPSLAFVMIGAIATASIGFYVSRRIEKPLLEVRKYLPTKQRIDGQLLIGSAIFGLGWGVAGFCPGPAVVAIGTAKSGAIIFFVAMLAGMLVFKQVSALRERANRCKVAGG
ncbi:YeeE/YedE family protein [Caballeronia insecticola]|uniref:YeeE/YedE family protein n=1 Tax=Caballeronia insecticola TaxID=758793 RepID=UPI0005C54C79|nr:YeeE/YedE family protein [Caballeronia insecticola]